jgi:hypothetical protein
MSDKLYVVYIDGRMHKPCTSKGGAKCSIAQAKQRWWNKGKEHEYEIKEFEEVKGNE